MVFQEKMVAVIKVNGRILRERNHNEVYIPFGSEYSILVKNLDSRRAAIKISIDGQDVFDNSEVIVNGNSEHEFKGFFKGNNVTNSFKFIKKTDDIIKHRGDRIDDGVVRIEYAFEKPIELIPWIMTTSSSSAGWGGSCNTLGYSDSRSFTSCYSVQNLCSNIKEDEGITVKGSKLNENYNYGYFGSREPSQVITLKLYGTNDRNVVISKPILVSQKLECETCGKMNRSNHNFCSRCGTSLI